MSPRLVKLTVDPGRARARLEPDSGAGGRSTASGTGVRRVAIGGGFLRLDCGDDQLANVMAVTWEADGCITLELAGTVGGREGERAPDIAEWWFG